MNIVLQILPLIVGPLAAFLTELAKKAPSVPFTGEKTSTLIVVLGALVSLLTLAGEIGVAYLSGNLAAYDWSRAINTLVQVVTGVLTAAGAYGLAKKAAG